MGDIVNLRLARKAKARSEKTSKSAENRVRFGRTKAETAALARRQEQQRAALDGHRLDDADKTDG